MSPHPLKKFKQERLLGRMGLATLALVLVAGCGASGDDGGGGSSVAPPSASSSETVEATPAPETPSSSVHEIGETVTMGALEHTLHSVRFAPGDEYTTPEPGTRWLVADIEVTNRSDEPASISSMGMWTLYDPDNRSVDQTITGDEQGSLDSELGPGRSLRGEIAFAVDESHDNWELIFSPEVLEFGQSIYGVPAPKAPESAPETEPANSESTEPDMPGAVPDQNFTYEEALAALEDGMPYYDAFCIHYEPTTDGGRSQCEGIEAGTVDSITGEYIGG
ncbi:DUF4352 domain-containing protein [Kocuria sp. CPCC 205263]|uniref:DUF4352 domain-containing protein n=1 Tax=Kocuria sp. CPCC 205263 TaxID=3073555 RepID=UPI0034D4436E